MDNELESRLRVLLDKQEIHDVLMRYCRGINRADRELIAAAYHPDALDDHGTFTARGSEIPDKIHAMLVAEDENTPSAMSFFMGNVLVEVEGDVAFSEAYWISYMEQQRDGKEYLRARCARFIDRFERREGKWKIAYRVVADEWSRVDEIVERAPARIGVNGPLRPGLRSKRDAVYAIRKGVLPPREQIPVPTH